MSENVEELLRTLASVDRRAAGWCVAQCVRTVLPLVPAGDDRPLKAIETTEAWVRGDASQEDCHSAACDADAAFADARSTSLACADAVYATAQVVYFAYYAAEPDAPPDTSYATEAAFVVAQVTAEAEAISFSEEAGDAACPCAFDQDVERHRATLLDLVSTFRWALTVPTPSQLRKAPETVQVVWDATTDGRNEQTLLELVEAHARAERLGLDWNDPIQRAIAERTTDEERVRALLVTGSRGEPP